MLSDSDLERILEVNGPALREYGYQTLQPLRNNVTNARRHGVGISQGRITAGVVAVSVLIPNTKRCRFWLLAFAAPARQMPKERTAFNSKKL